MATCSTPARPFANSGQDLESDIQNNMLCEIYIAMVMTYAAGRSLATSTVKRHRAALFMAIGFGLSSYG
jgi:hypothetical protein